MPGHALPRIGSPRLLALAAVLALAATPTRAIATAPATHITNNLTVSDERLASQPIRRLEDVRASEHHATRHPAGASFRWRGAASSAWHVDLNDHNARVAEYLLLWVRATTERNARVAEYVLLPTRHGAGTPRRRKSS